MQPEVEEIPDAEHELLVARVAAIDVAKASGKVCVRLPGRAGRRVSRVWDVAATSGAVTELAEHLVGQGIEKVTVESTSDYWRIWYYLLEAAGLEGAAGQRPRREERPGELPIVGSWRPLGPASAVTSVSIRVCITCRPAPTASASRPSCIFSAISAIATLTCSGNAVASTDLFSLLFFMTVPFSCWCVLADARHLPHGRNRAGDRHLETRSGDPDWAVHKIVDLLERHTVRAVVVDGISAASSMVDPLRRAGVVVTVTNAARMAAACGGFYDAVIAGRLRHLGQPTLSVALAAARKRRIGDGAWAWSRATSTDDISSLVAASLSLWGLVSSEIAPKPEQRTGRATFV